MIILSFVKSSDWFLADEAIILIVGVILGVPLELGIEVHVKERLASRLVLVLEVSEGHGSPSEPLQTLVPVNVHASNPVVSTILGVDNVQDSLDEVGLVAVQDISQVSTMFIAQLLSSQEAFMVAIKENQ